MLITLIMYKLKEIKEQYILKAIDIYGSFFSTSNVYDIYVVEALNTAIAFNVCVWVA